MVMRWAQQLDIEDLRNHSDEALLTLRKLLAGGAKVHPDPKRPNFYEVESGSVTYYVHVSPATGKILLLATWPSGGTLNGAPQAA